jgi:peroxiredoxin Q/BCP
VSADSIKKQKNFCSNQSFNFDLLSDESHEMLENYGVWGKKKFMGREYMGISRVTYIIDVDGTIKKIYDKVKTKTHAQDILNDL